MDIKELRETFDNFPIIAIKKVLFDYPRDCKLMDAILTDPVFLSDFLNEERLVDNEIKKSFRSMLIQSLIIQEDIPRIKKLIKNSDYGRLKKVLGRQGFYILQSGNQGLINTFLAKDLIPLTAQSFKYAYMFNGLNIAQSFPAPTLRLFKINCANPLFNASLDLKKFEHLSSTINYFDTVFNNKEYLFNNIASFKDEILSVMLKNLSVANKLNINDSELYDVYTEISRGKKDVLMSIIKKEIDLPLDKKISSDSFSTLSVAPKYNYNDGIHLFPASTYLKGESINLLTLLFLNHQNLFVDLLHKNKPITKKDLSECKKTINLLLECKPSNYVKQSLKLIDRFELSLDKEKEYAKLIDKNPDSKFAWGNNKLV